MEKKKLKGKIEDNIFRGIKDDQILETGEINPRELLNKKRFDVMGKYIYAKSKKTGLAKDWANLLYKENIRALNSFNENNNNKRSFSHFLKTFDKIIESIEKNGFDPNKSLIPVGEDFNPINGSHRIGASLALNKNINYIMIKKNTFSYNFKYIKEKGLSDIYLDEMALQYAKLKNNFHTAVVFPIVLEKIETIREILSKYGDIFYEKKIFLDRNGIHNLVIQMYREHTWTKEEKNKNFSKTLHHSYNRFVANKEIHIFFIEKTNLEKMKEAKTKIRNLFKKGNYPIHISDDDEESIRISEQILNHNSIHFLNNSVPKNNKKFNKLLNKFNHWIEKNNYNKDDFCIDGSSVLSAYGLREAKDLDYLSVENIKCNIDDIDLHNSEIKKYLPSPEDLIYDPRDYFYYNGYKFLTLKNLKKIKGKRKELKDRRDIKLINSILERDNLIKKTTEKIKYNFFIFIGFIIYIGRRYTPKIIFPYVKKVYRFFKKIIN